MKPSPLTRRALCASGTLLLLAGCAAMHDATDEPSTVIRLDGTATYRERMALPPGATLEVVVEDVSLADAPAPVLGRTIVQPAGNVPIPFSVEYPAASIVAGHRYGVRARIEHEGRLMFITDTFNELPSAGSPLELMLIRAQPARPNATLENTYWKLLRLGDTEVAVAPDQREPHMILQAPGDGTKRIAGFGGCNGMGGGYTLDGEQIAFTQMMSTLRACQHGMDTEHAFHQMLMAARRWAIRGEQLDLFDADGKRIALFESRYLQ